MHGGMRLSDGRTRLFRNRTTRKGDTFNARRRLESISFRPRGPQGRSIREHYLKANCRETTIDPQVRLSDLLIRAGLVTSKDVTAALERMKTKGGRMGDNLVAIGAIDQKTLDSFTRRIPREPATMAEVGIDETDLLGLFMKLVYTQRLEKVGQITEAIKLPQHIVMDLARMAIERQLIFTLSALSTDSILEMRYGITDEGKRWTVDLLKRSGYVGPAPVTLTQFVERVNLQKPTNERVTMDRVLEAIRGLTLDPTIVAQAGPALNSGRAMLLYGPPGNGKTSVALCIAEMFHDLIHVPYAVYVQGEIIRYYDPRVHLPLGFMGISDEDYEPPNFRRDAHDMRWISCRRPFVVAGGELTLEMLDLRYDETGHYYEAPLHMKALSGCFLIDDFGRQFVSPRDLLNRWIVPMESRVDYLKLQTGASFAIPFEELVIFATNLDPEELMDPAFLRRIPYKIEVSSPSLEQFRIIFENEVRLHGMALEEDIFKYIVYLIRQEKGLELAGFHPIFIIQQVMAACRFLGVKPELKSPFIDFAIDNLRVRRPTDRRREPGAPRPPAANETATRDRDTTARPSDTLPEY